MEINKDDVKLEINKDDVKLEINKDDVKLEIDMPNREKEFYLNEIQRLKKMLNKKIGLWWWKSYIASAFWSNIATPLNLSLSIITLLTTGQATSKTLFNDQTNLSLSITGLIISIFNSFFSPHQKMNENIKMMNQFRSFGEKYETILNIPTITMDDLMKSMKSYIELSKEFNDFLSDTPENRNFLTDLIHVLVSCCAKDKINVWIDKDDE